MCENNTKDKLAYRANSHPMVCRVLLRLPQDGQNRFVDDVRAGRLVRKTEALRPGTPALGAEVAHGWQRAVAAAATAAAVAVASQHDVAVQPACFSLLLLTFAVAFLAVAAATGEERRLLFYSHSRRPFVVVSGKGKEKKILFPPNHRFSPPSA